MKCNNKVERILIIFLWLTVGALVALIITNCIMFMLVDYGHMEHGSENFLTTVIQPILYALAIGFSLVSIVAFIVWFYRIYSNLITRGVPMKPSAAWALASWFVPFYNLFGPLLLMKKIFRETNKFLDKTDKETGLKEPLLDGWWFLAIATLVFIAIECTFRMTSTTSSGLFKAELLGTVCELAAALLCIRIVNLYGRITNSL